MRNSRNIFFTTIYGSSRIGEYQAGLLLADGGQPVIEGGSIYELKYYRGNKRYEIANHLGNVLATITDRKIAISQTGSLGNYAFLPEITSFSDYYPFGMEIEARSWAYTGEKYRYAFNGKEKDNESFEGALDFGARIYDSRIGRWLAVDAYSNSFSNENPYIYTSDNPLIYIDNEGNWKELKITRYYRDKNNNLKVKKWFNIFKKTVQIDINLTVHNLKVLDLTIYYYTEEDYKICIENIKNQITYDFLNMPIQDAKNIKINRNISFIDDNDGRPSVVTKEDFNKLKLKGKKADDLIVIGHFDLINHSTSLHTKILAGKCGAYVSKNTIFIQPNDAFLRTNNKINLEFEKGDKTLFHEFLHTLSLEDNNEHNKTIMDNTETMGNLLDFQEHILHLREKKRNANFRINKAIKYYDKKVDKYKKQNSE